jgi:hypothetical protein
MLLTFTYPVSVVSELSGMSMSWNAINHRRTVTCVKQTRNTVFYHTNFTFNTAIVYGLINKMFTASSICPQSLLFISLAHSVFARVICALFFILAAEKSGCVKYTDFFFVEVLMWVLVQYNWECGTFCQYFIVIL